MDYAIKVGGGYHEIEEGQQLYIRSSGCSKLIWCNTLEHALEFLDQLYDGAADDGRPERFELVATFGKTDELFPVVRIEEVVREYTNG